MSNLFSLNLKDLAGSILSGVIVAVLGFISSSANIFALDWNAILNIAVLTAIASLLKSLSTDGNGKFLGGISVK